MEYVEMLEEIAGRKVGEIIKVTDDNFNRMELWVYSGKAKVSDAPKEKKSSKKITDKVDKKKSTKKATSKKGAKK